LLLGRYLHSLDHKGRVSIPKKFREKLSNGGVLTKGLDGCLFLYPFEEWTLLSSKIQALPLTGSEERAFSRYLFSGAVQVGFDPLGRILIPEHLQRFAQFKKEILVIGVANRIELWAKRKWEVYNKTIEAKSEEIAEKISDRGI